MKKRILIGSAASIGLAVLIFDAATALNAAREAVQLCLNVVIPSLFPFFVLINVLNGSMAGAKLHWMEKILNIPTGSGSIFLSGLLGGYPTGAQLVQTAWKDGALEKRDAERMLGFCNNAGPAFLFGIIGPMFSSRLTVWLIWGIHILSAIVVARITEREASYKNAILRSSAVSFPEALRRSVMVMAYVCGWIVLFRVVAAFCMRWFLWAMPDALKVAFICLLELANGSATLHLIENEGLRMIIATAAVNFGGVCVLMQTASVTAGLKIGSYIRGKFVQTFIGIILTAIAQLLLFSGDDRISIHPLMIGFAALVPLLGKITVAFPKELVYNKTITKRKG